MILYKGHFVLLFFLKTIKTLNVDEKKYEHDVIVEIVSAHINKYIRLHEK